MSERLPESGLPKAQIDNLIGDFEQQLLQMQRALTEGEVQIRQVAQLQANFRTQLLPLAMVQPAQTAILTEINRHLRLLSVDATFLQAARQPQTRQQRIGRIRERIQQLLGFVQALTGQDETR